MLCLLKGSPLPLPNEGGMRSQINLLFDNVSFVEIITILKLQILKLPIKVIIIILCYVCSKALLFLILVNEE